MKAFDMSKFRNGLTKAIPSISSGFNDPDVWISTGNYALNYIISSDFNKGIPLGKSVMFAGESGCLPSSSKVQVSVDGDDVHEVTIGDLKHLVEVASVQIDTPDGLQPIGQWYDKGVLEMVRVVLENGLSTNCAINHMLQVQEGGVVDHPASELQWKAAETLAVGDSVLTVHGWSEVTSIESIESEECFDFEVMHDNHRYFGDGISSHNSGKSFLVSGSIVKNAQAMGVYPIVIDTENALDKEWLEAVGVDTSIEKMERVSASMIDDVALYISNFIKEYRKLYGDLERSERPKILFVIDSLGMMMTPTDVAQFEKGDMKGDMGRKPRALKALITNITNMFGDLNIGLVTTNHTYASQDMFDPSDKISGGCLVAGTQLFLEDGTLKNIEDMQIGDVVKTRNGSDKVVNLWHYQKPTFTLELSDGSVFECSPEHKFLVLSDGVESWVEAKNLDEGMELVAI